MNESDSSVQRDAKRFDRIVKRSQANRNQDAGTPKDAGSGVSKVLGDEGGGGISSGGEPGSSSGRSSHVP